MTQRRWIVRGVLGFLIGVSIAAVLIAHGIWW